MLALSPLCIITLLRNIQLHRKKCIWVMETKLEREKYFVLKIIFSTFFNFLTFKLWHFKTYWHSNHFLVFVLQLFASTCLVFIEPMRAMRKRCKNCALGIVCKGKERKFWLLQQLLGSLTFNSYRFLKVQKMQSNFFWCEYRNRKINRYCYQHSLQNCCCIFIKIKFSRYFLSYSDILGMQQNIPLLYYLKEHKSYFHRRKISLINFDFGFLS